MKAAIKIIYTITFFLLPLSQNVNAAIVTSVSQQSELNLGTVAVGDSGGFINSAGSVSGTVNSLGGFSHGSFLVSGENNRTGAKANRTKFKVFLQNNFISLNNAGNVIYAQLSLNSSSNVTALEFDFPEGSGSQTANVVIYGRATLVPNQTDGKYTNSYILTFCECSSSGCPNSTSDARCL